MVGVVVNEGGNGTHVQRNIVEVALIQAFQTDSRSEISNLNLGVASAPNVSETQRNNAIDVVLTDTKVSQVSICS